MGLDCIWKTPRANKAEPVFIPPLQLCEGMFSRGGEGSFRGKVYNDVVTHLSGISLYASLDNAAVGEIAVAFEKDWEDLPRELQVISKEDYRRVGYPVTKEEYLDLRRMFRAYADAGYSLYGWY